MSLCRSGACDYVRNPRGRRLQAKAEGKCCGPVFTFVPAWRNVDPWKFRGSPFYGPQTGREKEQELTSPGPCSRGESYVAQRARSQLGNKGTVECKRQPGANLRLPAVHPRRRSLHH